MGQPENPEEFVEFPLRERGRQYGTLFIARDIFDQIDPGAKELLFHLQEYGRFRLKLEREPAGDAATPASGTGSDGSAT